MGLNIRLLTFLRFRAWIIAPFLACIFLAMPAWAQRSGRTIVDFQVRDGRLLVEIALNAEAVLAGVDPQEVAKGGDGGSARYAQLRRLVSSELEEHVHDFVTDWKQSLRIDVNGPVALSYEGASIPVVGNPDVPRISRVLLAGPLPPDVSSLRLTWPEGIGPVVLRQQGVEAPYTGFLSGGEVSPRIPLAGGAGLGAQQAAEAFFRAGLLHVAGAGAQLLALASVLVFLSLKLRPVLVQLAALGLGVLVTLPLGMFDVLNARPFLPWPVVPAAIALLALWNLVTDRLGVWRVLFLLATGAVLGLTLSETSSRLGVPPHHVAPAVLGFAAGILLALSGVAILILATLTVLLPDSPRLRGRISTVASLLLAGLGLYWAVVS
ncbi:HupE/UreJ family protein [Ruegeria arenilitoris]|uniref:HupE/UreJ family protein n=1 Tax=Ruegeria arenilitoris TaxID=1173585 RepID=UPI0014804F74|nr:HupE/UreJ family protein [Ruegeria arenilitoris]